MLGGIPRGSPNSTSHGLVKDMFIVDHIGDSINEYRLLAGRYFPATCPECGWDEKFRRHGHYMHNAGDVEPVPVFRFRCNQKGCRQVFSVLPDLFTPNQSLPTSTEEQAVLQYAATLGTCAQVAETAGVSASTVWRWVHRAASRVDQWISDMQRWLQEALVGDYVAVDVDDTLRPRWRSRRIRLQGKVTQLLLLDRLPRLVKQCRKTVTEILGRRLAASVPVAWPTTSLGFCRQVLPELLGSDFPTHKPEKRGAFQPARVGHGGEPHG